MPRRQSDDDAGRDRHALARRNRNWGAGGHCGEEIKSGGALGLIGRQREIGCVWQTQDAQFGVHRFKIIEIGHVRCPPGFTSNAIAIHLR
jgi:hypothetical protein